MSQSEKEACNILTFSELSDMIRLAPPTSLPQFAASRDYVVIEQMVGGADWLTFLPNLHG